MCPAVHKAKPGGGFLPAPGFAVVIFCCGGCRPTSVILCAQHADQLRQKVAAAGKRDAADVLADALDVFQLLELVQRLILLHQFCRVEQRPRGRDFFAAGDDVRLRPLFGDEHRVHDLADLAGENDVLDTRVFDFHEKRRLLLPQARKHKAGKPFLVFQDLVQPVFADKIPQGKLRRDVELLDIVVDLGENADVVRDAVTAHEVDAQRDLILRHDLLPGDVHLQKARVHEVNVHLHAAVPEGIGAGLEQPHKFVVEEQARLLISRHLDRFVKARLHPVEDVAREIRGNLGGGNVHHAEFVRVAPVAEGVFPGSGDGASEAAVHEVQGDLLVADLHGRDQLCKIRVCEQGIQRAVFAVDDLPLLEDLHGSAAEQAVFARADGLLILAVFEKESVLVFVDDYSRHM